MGTLASTLTLWASLNPDRLKFYAGHPEVVLRWLNEAQLQFANKSEIMQSVWTPTITSTGSIALPSDFLREFPDRVKWSTNMVLRKMNYEDAAMITTWGGVIAYSIYNGSLYIFAPTAGTPTIPYIKKPLDFDYFDIASEDLTIPTEYHDTLLIFLDAMWQYNQGDIEGNLKLRKYFDDECEKAGQLFRDRRDAVPIMRSTRF